MDDGGGAGRLQVVDAWRGPQSPPHPSRPAQPSPPGSNRRRQWRAKTQRSPRAGPAPGPCIILRGQHIFSPFFSFLLFEESQP